MLSAMPRMHTQEQELQHAYNLEADETSRREGPIFLDTVCAEISEMALL